MRHLCEYSALCVIGLAILTSNVRPTYAQHIHDSHPTTGHGPNDEWVRISMEDGSEDNSFPEVTLDTDGEDILYTETVDNTTCDDVTMTVSETRSRTNTVAVNWDVGVTGTGTWAAEALFTKLEAKVEISVERGQSWTVSETQSFTVSQTTEADPCHQLSFESKVAYRTATGTVTTGDHVIVCQCTVCGDKVTSYCNEVVISGTADGYSEHHSEWNEEELEEDCGCDD